MTESLLAQAAPFVGAPYRLHGRIPDGWDCWGCVHYLRETLLGKATPSWADLYSPLDGASGARILADKTQRLIAERLHAWTAVPPRAGAVVLLTVFDRAAHVGLMLDGHNFIHALGTQPATVINTTRDPRWVHRVRGFYDA